MLSRRRPGQHYGSATPGVRAARISSTGWWARRVGAVRDLLAARHPGRGDDRVVRLGAHRREQPVLADLHRHVVVLGLEPERARPSRSTRRRARRPRRPGSAAAARPWPPCRPRPSGGSARGRGCAARRARRPRAAAGRRCRSPRRAGRRPAGRGRPRRRRAGRRRSSARCSSRSVSRQDGSTPDDRPGRAGERVDQPGRLPRAPGRAGPSRTPPARSSRRPPAARPSRPAPAARSRRSRPRAR